MDPYLCYSWALIQPLNSSVKQCVASPLHLKPPFFLLTAPSKHRVVVSNAVYLTTPHFLTLYRANKKSVTQVLFFSIYTYSYGTI